MIIETDYGIIPLSDKTMAWLNNLDHNWHEIVNNKRKRGKHAQYLRQKVKELETAVMVCSEIEWNNGGVLDKF